MTVSPRSLAGLLALVLLFSLGSAWWRGRGEDALGARLAAAARPGDIRMLSSLTCVYCERARLWLGAQRVPFSECFIERDAACAQQYRALGARGTPTLLVRGQPQLGFDPQRVLAALQPGG